MTFTDEELRLIEADEKYPLKPHKAQALAAEARRLRSLVKRAETLGISEQDLRARNAVNCPWCRYDTSFKKKHAPECVAFTEDGAVR